MLSSCKHVQSTLCFLLCYEVTGLACASAALFISLKYWNAKQFVSKDTGCLAGSALPAASPLQLTHCLLQEPNVRHSFFERNPCTAMPKCQLESGEAACFCYSWRWNCDTASSALGSAVHPLTAADFKVCSILEPLQHSPLCDYEAFFCYYSVAKTPVSLAGYISDHSNNMWNEYDSYEMHSQLLGLNPSSSAWWSANRILDRDFIPSKRTIKPTWQ